MQHLASMLFFGEACAEDEDLAELQAFLTTEAATLAGASLIEQVQAVAVMQQQRDGPIAAMPAAPPDRRPPPPPQGCVSPREASLRCARGSRVWTAGNMYLLRQSAVLPAGTIWVCHGPAGRCAQVENSQGQLQQSSGIHPR